MLGARGCLALWPPSTEPASLPSTLALQDLAPRPASTLAPSRWYTPRVKLTVTVITRNEAANIEGALESVKWADEIVVVDSHSADETVALAERHAPGS